MHASHYLCGGARSFSQSSTRHRRNLLLTFDAFETLFYPSPPVPDQYAAIGHAFGLPKTVVTPKKLKAAFKDAFGTQSARYPNYGRADVLEGRYGGPKQWWEEVIRNSFAQVLAQESSDGVSSTSVSCRGNTDLPSGMVGSLLNRFAGDGGYLLYDDVMPFFERMREIRATSSSSGKPFDRIVVGVVSNSDDRISEVLKSLGLRVGCTRADVDRSSTELPGFEEQVTRGADRLEADSASMDAQQSTDLDMVITSYEAGAEKPNRLIFDVAKRQAQRLVQQQGSGFESNLAFSGETSDWACVHVGDDYQKDLIGATDAGWESFLLERGDGGKDPATTIRSLMDLLKRLQLDG
ncbi:hypothetical protein PDE_01862 [Penicillium oxalicum 114-2]|uniref:Haloacid dehalogenase-like hydrolase n=1 Tax=Penicillium oxalicum (strain 114-2 / CGMCC 5302) TaxID=933388 RepID=S8AY84_PENO1|nr:hypothetical protein PDE_01862 [Penicillium oxalicum 114-2]